MHCNKSVKANMNILSRETILPEEVLAFGNT